MRAGERVARGRASWRVRVVTWAALGGYAAAALLGTLAGGNSGPVAMAVVLFGAVTFWLGRRSAMETASAEAVAWATATASAEATANALAAVQVHLDVDNRRVELMDATGLHRRAFALDGESSGRLLPRPEPRIAYLPQAPVAGWAQGVPAGQPVGPLAAAVTPLAGASGDAGSRPGDRVAASVGHDREAANPSPAPLDAFEAWAARQARL